MTRALGVAVALEKGAGGASAGHDQRGSAGAAAHQAPHHPGSGSLTLVPPVGRLALLHAALHSLPQVHGDDRRVLAVHNLHAVRYMYAGIPGFVSGRPTDLPDVYGVAEHILHKSVVRPVAAPRSDPGIAQLHGDVPEPGAIGVGAEHIAHDLRPFRIHREGLVGTVDAVAEGRCAHGFAPEKLFAHAALDLGGQVDKVIFVKPLDDAFDQRAEGAVHGGLLDGDHGNALFAQQTLVQHALLSIAGKAAEHQHQDRVKGPFFLLGQGDHAVEGRALPGGGGGNAVILEHIFLRQQVSVLPGILPDEPDLAVRGVLLLVVGGYPDIGGGNFQITGGHGVSPFTVSESGTGVANSNTKTAIMQSKRRRHLESR